MSSRRPVAPLRRRVPPRRRTGTTPQTIVFDEFTLDAVQGAKKFARERARYYWDYYAALAQQRAENSDEIKKALVGAAEGPYSFRCWQRIVDYQYSLHPLSTVGSVVTDPGGRFNIGDIDTTRFSPFPALYIAADLPTAMIEKFGPSDGGSGLSNLDFALRSGASFSCVSVSGALDTVIDLRRPERLQAFVDIIKRFKLPSDLAGRGRALMQSPPRTVRSTEDLVEAVMTPKWRDEPMQVDIPAASQLFGQLIWTSGIEGIVFPSVKSGETCLAIFPANLSASSYAKLDDAAPAGVTHLRLDGTTYRDFVP